MVEGQDLIINGYLVIDQLDAGKAPHGSASVGASVIAR